MSLNRAATAAAVCLSLALAAPSSGAPAGRYPVKPADLKAKYLKMSFTAEGQKVSFSLDKLQYQNPHFDALNRAKLKDRFLAQVNAALGKDADGSFKKAAAPYELKKNSPIFHRVFNGEGTPDEIATVLKLAARLKSKLGAEWKEKGNLSDTLKAFYFDNIGLNCNGFVGSYAKAVGAKQTPNTSIIAYASPNSRRIKKLADIQPGDVMVWKNNKHITAIQGKRADGNYDIVESAGDYYIKGLGNSVWKFNEPKAGDVWKVTKVAPGGTGKSTEVYIARLK